MSVPREFVDALQYPEMNLDIERITVTAKSRSLKATWGYELPETKFQRFKRNLYARWLRLKWVWRRNVHPLR